MEVGIDKKYWNKKWWYYNEKKNKGNTANWDTSYNEDVY